MRVGIVGAGGMAGVHAEAWRTLGVRLAFYAPERTERVRRDEEAEAATLEDLVAASDLLDVCSPTPAHPDAVRAAIRGGVPVVCEKPLALTADEADALVSEAAEASVAIFPAHVVRWFPEYAAARDAVRSGGIGTPAVARFVRSGEFPRWATWLGDDARSGGIVLDQMIHDLDVAAWILGDVVRVSGAERRGPDGERVAHVLLTHRSGAVSSCTGVWGAPGLAFATRFSIAGSDGRIEHDSRSGASVAIDRGSALEVASRRPAARAGADPYRDELADALRAVREGGTTRTSPAEAARAVRIARAAIAAIRTGQPVDVGGPS